MTYTGETGKRFSTQLKKHATSQRLNDGKSLLREYTNNEQHTNKQHNKKLHNAENGIISQKLKQI